MKPFRKSRDFDGRFALTTLQNPDLNVESHLSFIIAAKNRAEARVEAEMTAEMAAEIAAEQAAEAAPGPASHVPAPYEPPHPPKPEPILAPEPAPPILRKISRRNSPLSPKRKKTRARVATREKSLQAAPPLTKRERHARKCAICSHPDREEIEDEFMHWRRPERVISEFGLRYSDSLRRHARATGLYERRRTKSIYALEAIIEKAESVVPTAEGVIRAIRACSLINERGEWHDPPSHVIVSGTRGYAPNSLPAPPVSSASPGNLRAPIDVEILPALCPPDLPQGSVSNRTGSGLEKP